MNIKKGIVIAIVGLVVLLGVGLIQLSSKQSPAYSEGMNYLYNSNEIAKEYGAINKVSYLTSMNDIVKDDYCKIYYLVTCRGTKYRFSVELSKEEGSHWKVISHTLLK